MHTGLFINGAFVDAVAKGTFEVVNPATLEVVAKVQKAEREDIDAAVEAAASAQPAWAALPPNTRAKCLNKLAELIEMEEHSDRIRELDAISMGRPKATMRMDISITTSKLRWAASLAPSLLGESSYLSDGQLNLTMRQPYGVVGAIIPWNVPSIMWAGKVGPAVAAGNAIVLKSSEKSPLGALYLAALTVEAGFPAGVINIVSGMGPTGQAIAEHMKIRKIGFTGSTRTGRSIMESAARSNLKQVVLELGGKSPTIVFADADLDLAIPASVFSAQWNSGQVCMASTRLYVQESIASAFLDRFKKSFAVYQHGHPLDGNASMGPQADEIQGKTVVGYLERGKAEGKVETGGNRVGTKGYFIEPTVFSGIADKSVVNTEEIFGPVVVFHTFVDEKEAVQRANDTEYGLYASVFTQDVDRAMRVSKALEAGTVAVNTTSPAGAAEVSFGGWKQSGFGREGGMQALYSWTEEKSVLIKYKTA